VAWKGQPGKVEEELSTAPESSDDVAEEETVGGEGDADPQEAASLTPQELAQRWVSYAVGIALKRFARPGLETLTSTDGPMVVQRDHPDDLAARAISTLPVGQDRHALLAARDAGRLQRQQEL
jgi:hypothetical protein